MTHLLKIVCLILVFFSGTAWCCSEGKTWDDFSEISFTSEDDHSLTLKRFSDGIYVRLQDKVSTKEMYSLPNSIYLFKGYDPSIEPTISPFLMLDIPISIVRAILAGYFPEPCAVPTIPTPFAYTNSNIDGTIVVNGKAHLDSESTMIFDFVANPQDGQGATIKTSGAIKFNDIKSIPLDTDISNWLATRSKGMQYDPIKVQPENSILKDILYLIQHTRNQ